MLRSNRVWKLVALAALAVTVLAVRGVAHAAGLPQDTGDLGEVQSLIEAVVRIFGIVLPVIGVTGGLKGLFGKAPDLHFGLQPDGSYRFVLPGGLWLSWLVALPLTAVAYMQGWAPDLSSYGSPEAAIAGLWAFVAAVANMIRNTMKGSDTAALLAALRAR